MGIKWRQTLAASPVRTPGLRKDDFPARTFADGCRGPGAGDRKPGNPGSSLPSPPAAATTPRPVHTLWRIHFSRISRNSHFVQLIRNSPSNVRALTWLTTDRLPANCDATVFCHSSHREACMFGIHSIAEATCEMNEAPPPTTPTPCVALASVSVSVSASAPPHRQPPTSDIRHPTSDIQPQPPMISVLRPLAPTTADLRPPSLQASKPPSLQASRPPEIQASLPKLS
jgi:hypothetical protein